HQRAGFLCRLSQFLSCSVLFSLDPYSLVSLTGALVTLLCLKVLSSVFTLSALSLQLMQLSIGCREALSLAQQLCTGAGLLHALTSSLGSRSLAALALGTSLLIRAFILLASRHI